MSLSRREWLRQGAAFTASASMLPSIASAADEAAAQTKEPKPDPYAGATFVDGPPPLPADGGFTVAVLPDTQFYTERHPENFHAQTEWIVDQAKDRRIAAVLHLGDITNKATPEQWEIASQAMARLDRHVPYFMVVGNHDYGPGGCVSRATPCNNAFPLTRFQEQAEFGGAYDREPELMQNTFHLFSAGDRKFLVICLEYGPRHDVVRWANEVAAKHADRQAILITHAYMYYDDTRYDWDKYRSEQRWNPRGSKMATNTHGDATDGEQLWQGLVSRHENFILTLNGHVIDDGLGRLTSATPGGRNVHQMLVNFQMKPHGGDGWLRLLQFQPDGRTIDVCDYSPSLDRQNHSPQNKFTLRTSAAEKA